MGTYGFVIVPEPNKEFNQVLMLLVLLLICAPSFLVAAIAAIASACNPRRHKQALGFACLLIVLQLFLWACFIAGVLGQRQVGSGRAGGF